jgi:hypothetical protein
VSSVPPCETSFQVHRGFPCTPRMAGSGGGSPRATTFPARPQGLNAPGFPGDVGNGRRMEVRQEAIRDFSGNPFPAAALHSPPSGIIRCAIPRTLPSHEPLRERLPSRGPRLRGIAHRVFVEAGSGALAAGRRRRAGGADGGIGVSQKMRMAPCRASLPLPFPTRPLTRGATPARRLVLTPFHCIASHLAPGERDAQVATQPAMNLFSGTPFPPQRPAAHHPASSDARSREPSPRANPCGNAPGLLAGPGFAGSRIRMFVEAGSGALAAGRPRRAGGADGGIGISQKMRMAPCRASVPLPFPTPPHKRGAIPARPPCPDTLPLHRGSSRPLESGRAVCHQIRDEPFFRGRSGTRCRGLDEVKDRFGFWWNFEV